MAKKLNEFIKNLIIKAGGNPEDEALKNGITSIGQDLEISDDLVTSIDNGLLSISTAKNNHPDIKGHYFAQAYSGLDNELQKLIDTEKLPEEVVAEIKKESSSTKRAVLIATKIKELEGKKANANKTDASKLNDQIADLNNQLRAEKESKAELEKKHQADVKNVKKSFALNQLLSGYQTTHDHLDPETKNIILSAVINKHLKSKKADWDINDTDEFILVGEGNTHVFSEDNRQLTPKSFIEKVLADEKMLKVTDQNNNNGGGNGNNQNNNNSHRPVNNGQHSNNGQKWQQNNNGHNNNGNRSTVLQELIQKSQNDLAKAANNGTRIG